MPGVLADKFWDLGNYVVGFAAAQAVAFSISIGTSGHLRNRIRPGWKLILGVTAVATVFYVTGIAVCAALEARLRAGNDDVTFAVWAAAVLRGVAVVAVNALVASAVLLNRRP
jgi:hypothetical protein